MIAVEAPGWRGATKAHTAGSSRRLGSTLVDGAHPSGSEIIFVHEVTVSRTRSPLAHPQGRF